MTGVLIKILMPLIRALVPLILDEIRKHPEAEMVGGGEEARDAVNDSVRSALDAD